MAKKEKYSKERIKAEMDEAKWKSIVCGILVGIFVYLAIIFAEVASYGFGFGQRGGLTSLLWVASGYDSAKAEAMAWGIATLLGIATLFLIYGIWHYTQSYKRWKSML